jgi:Tfp pilus assembly protein PilF
MKITRRQLRRIIREATQRPMTADYVYDQLMGVQDFGPRKGLTRMQMAMDAIAAGDFIRAVNHVEDALWIDDPPLGAEEELAGLIAGVRSEDELVAIAAEWGTRHFRSR